MYFFLFFHLQTFPYRPFPSSFKSTASVFTSCYSSALKVYKLGFRLSNLMLCKSSGLNGYPGLLVCLGHYHGTASIVTVLKPFQEPMGSLNWNFKIASQSFDKRNDERPKQKSFITLQKCGRWTLNYHFYLAITKAIRLQSLLTACDHSYLTFPDFILQQHLANRKRSSYYIF